MGCKVRNRLRLLFSTGGGTNAVPGHRIWTRLSENLLAQARRVAGRHEKAPALWAAGAYEADGTVGGQVLKESLGVPSSIKSPARFTMSLRRDEAAKMTRPTGAAENGEARAMPKPAALPMKERIRMVLAFIRSGWVSTVPWRHSPDGGRWRSRYSRRMRRQR